MKFWIRITNDESQEGLTNHAFKTKREALEEARETAKTHWCRVTEVRARCENVHEQDIDGGDLWAFDDDAGAYTAGELLLVDVPITPAAMLDALSEYIPGKTLGRWLVMVTRGKVTLSPRDGSS